MGNLRWLDERNTRARLAKKVDKSSDYTQNKKNGSTVDVRKAALLAKIKSKK